MGFVDVGNNSGGCDVLFILRIADGVVVAYSHDEYGLYIGESGGILDRERGLLVGGDSAVRWGG